MSLNIYKRYLRSHKVARERELESKKYDDIVMTSSGEANSPITIPFIEWELKDCWKEGVGGLILRPNQPVQDGARVFRALEASIFSRGRSSEKISLTFEYMPAVDGDDQGIQQNMDFEQAMNIIQDFLMHKLPDTSGWRLVEVIDPVPGKPVPPNVQMTLLLKDGTSQTQTTYETFSRETIDAAMKGLMDGSYQSVQLTMRMKSLWIRAKSANAEKKKCIIEATRPDTPINSFFTKEMTTNEASAWLIGYTDESFLPVRNEWKYIETEIKGIQ